MPDIIDDIQANIDWIDKHSKSTNISSLSSVLSKMSVQCFYFAKLVVDAYELMNNAEGEYKEAKARFIRDCSESATKATAIVDADPEVSKAKKDYTQASNLHYRLKTYAAQFDTIMDCARQRVSVQKTLEGKHI